MWSIAREWESDQVGFVLAGGASVRNLDLSLLKGRRVIAINSAHLSWPDADILFFADHRWWTDVGSKEAPFKGRIVTTSNGGPRDVLRLTKIDPSKGLATKPDQIALSRSGVTGAINILVHLGVKRIVLLGVDGKVTQDGQRHHHGAAYPWPMVKGCFDHHAAEFKTIAPSVRAAGVEIINANPDSAIDAWPKMSFGDVVSMLTAAETTDRRCYICNQEDPDGRKRHVIIQGKKYRIEWNDSGIVSVDLVGVNLADCRSIEAV